MDGYHDPIAIVMTIKAAIWGPFCVEEAEGEGEGGTAGLNI